MKKIFVLCIGVFVHLIPVVSMAASDYISDTVGSVCYDEDELDSESSLYRVVHCPIDVYKSVYEDMQYYDEWGSFVNWADNYFGDVIGPCPEMVDDMDAFDSEGNSNRCYVDVTDSYVAICARVGENGDACTGCKLPDIGDLVYDEWVGFNENDTLARRKKIVDLETEYSTYGYLAYETNWTCYADITMDYEYACNAGYYTDEINLNVSSQCNMCPEISNGVHGTSPVGNMSIDNCCVAAGTSVVDETGTFVFESKCCYQ